MPKLQLTDSDFDRAANALGVSVPAIKAVAEVESRGEGFLDTGEPKILFEPHIFSRLTGGVYDKSHPDISYPKWKSGAYGPISAQHGKLQRAAALDRDAAMQSASWGLFQVMGFNWKAAGFKSLQAFVNAMYKGVDGHMDALVGFISGDHDMLRALQNLRWGDFARLYNGPGYKANRYDEKMAASYRKHGGVA